MSERLTDEQVAEQVERAYSALRCGMDSEGGARGDRVDALLGDEYPDGCGCASCQAKAALL